MKTATKKMNVEQLRNFWNALPERRGFDFNFDSQIGDVTNAQRRIDEAKRALAEAEEWHKEALETLNRQVESGARADWSDAEIAEARKEAGL